jgi:tRNA(Ile)-lysidine synthase
MPIEKELTLQKLDAILRSLTQSNNFYVGFSGGLDSCVLLHALSSLGMQDQERSIKITAIHINHGLSANANHWDNFCRDICEKLQVAYISKKIDVKANLISGKSVEAVARKLRYAVFANIVPRKAVLLTAHQADDQAETLLLQLFRGAGPKGLAAMPQEIAFANDVTLIRPLLNFSRQALLSYAKQNNLKWIEDESNFDIAFDRNFLRHQVFPTLCKNWPGIVKTLIRAAGHCAEADILLQELAAQDWQVAAGAVKNTLSIKKLLTLSESRCTNLLRYWLQQKLALPLSSTKKMLAIREYVLNSRSDAAPIVQWEGVEIRKYQDDLYAMPPLCMHDAEAILPWHELREPLVLPNNLGTLRCQNLSSLETAMSQNISVRFRQGGEHFIPRGRKFSHALKNLFQEWKIPPWQRDRTPLIYFNDQLVAVIGYAVAGDFNFLIDFLQPIDK